MSDYDQLAYHLRRPLAPYLLPFSEDKFNTYTPTYVGGTTAGATTYTTQQGAWWLFGPVMFVTGTVTWTAASGTGTARISLPIAAANVSNQTFGGSAALQSVTFANGSPQIVISPNTAYFILISPLTNAVSTNVAVEAAGTVVFSLFFAIE